MRLKTLVVITLAMLLLTSMGFQQGALASTEGKATKKWELKDALSFEVSDVQMVGNGDVVYISQSEGGYARSLNRVSAG